MLQCAVKHETRIPGLTIGNEMTHSVLQAEDRLHAGMLRFNTLISETNHMKEEIELLQKEREIVSGIQRKLEAELKKRSNDASNLIESSKASHTAREYCLTQLKQLKGIADKEHAEYTKKMRELLDLLEADKSAHDSMQKEDFSELIGHESSKSQQATEEVLIRSEPEPVVPDSTPRLSILTQLFEDIRDATGMTDIGEILDFFHVKELENSSLFMKYNLNVTEIEQLEHHLEYTKEEINRVRLSLVHSSGGSLSVRSKSEDQATSGRTTMRGIEVEAGAIKKHSDEVAARIAQLSKLSESVRIMVKSIFIVLFNDPDSVTRFLPQEVLAGCSGSAGVPVGVISESNMVGYLSAIECRVNSMILEELP